MKGEGRVTGRSYREGASEREGTEKFREEQRNVNVRFRNLIQHV